MSDRSVTVKGTTIEVDYRPDSADAAVWAEVWDERIYEDLSPSMANAVVVDIGANVGAFALWALNHDPLAVQTYEPEVDNYRVLLSNVLALAGGVAHRVSSYRAAVGDHDGRASFTGSSGQAHVDPDGPTVVPLIGIEQVVASACLLGNRLVVKMDCEGSEYAIVRAMPEATLDKIELMVMEFHATEPAMCSERVVDQWGAMVTKLAEQGHVKTFGRPSVGGMLTWRHY